MTPPKPLTEKDKKCQLTKYDYQRLDEIRNKFYRIDEGLHGSYHYEPLSIDEQDELIYIATELKRLRAGQARETSSRSEVKILRDALNKSTLLIKGAIDHFEDGHPSNAKIFLRDNIDDIRDAIEAADEINEDGNKNEKHRNVTRTS